MPVCHSILASPLPAQFIDAHGLEEAGVDGGGIFKEFVETVRCLLLKEIYLTALPSARQTA